METEKSFRKYFLKKKTEKTRFLDSKITVIKFFKIGYEINLIQYNIKLINIL
jgi:hypothetical protein